MLFACSDRINRHQVNFIRADCTSTLSFAVDTVNKIVLYTLFACDKLITLLCHQINRTEMENIGGKKTELRLVRHLPGFRRQVGQREQVD